MHTFVHTYLTTYIELHHICPFNKTNDIWVYQSSFIHASILMHIYL